MPLWSSGSGEEMLMKIEDSTIGFIGLGAMGQRMVRRLLDHRFHLNVFDHSAAHMDGLKTAGAMPSASLRALAANSRVIISCLPDDAAVLEVYSGERGVLAAAQPGTVAIEMSTVSALTSQTLFQTARERRVEILDVTISGSTPAAEEGTLVLFGGGDQQVFERCTPIFRALARAHFYMGKHGAGSKMKLVVNTILGVNMQAIAEAAALGERMGLDRSRMLEVLAHTAVVAPAHQGKLLRAEHEDFSPQFPLRLMGKDFKLILEEANELRVPMPATTASYAVNRKCAERGEGLDFSSVMDEMRRRARDEAVVN
jgi:3-hydroxyisobutyrate dehydrogenase-like beta-hydroxyacid dehydrogenase